MRQIFHKQYFSAQSNPIAIAAETNVATVTESATYLGRLMDGMTGIISGDNLTSSEARMAVVGYGLLFGIGGGMLARKRTNDGKDPILGFIL